jgi:hypothetical protein
MSKSSGMQVTGSDVFDPMKPSNLQEPFAYLAKLREENRFTGTSGIQFGC